MTAETDDRFPSEELVEQYIENLQWSGQQTSHEEDIVAGNIRSFAWHLRGMAGEKLQVVRAAIRDRFGGVHSVPQPGRHNDVIAKMVKAGLPTPIQGEQGFLLSDGRFVMRKAAAKVAVNAGQCESVELPGTGLLSQDVW